MTPAKKPPQGNITVKIPPKKSGAKHVPTENDYWRQFVKKHNLSSSQAQAISVAASGHSLPRLYLAALAVSNPALLKDNNRLNSYAAKESARLGTTNNPNPEAIGLLPPKYAQSIHWKTWGTSATSSLGAAGVKGGLADPVLRDKKGHAIKDEFGQPITRNTVIQERNTYNDLFQYYVGRNMTTQEAIKFAKNHWSSQSIADKYLTKLPGFFKGKVYKENLDSLMTGPGGWEEVYGVSNLKPPKDLVRQAILRGKGGAGWFADQIRKLPQYKTSVEYKKFDAQFSQVYNQIWGAIGGDGKKLISDAIMHRMSADEFAANLRKAPGYENSLEQRAMVEKSASAAGVYMPWHEKAGPSTTVEKPKPAAVTNSQEPKPLPPYRPNPPKQQPHTRPLGSYPGGP